MLSGRFWPAHPKPFDDELLSSWLFRIAHANGLKLQSFCHLVFGAKHQLWNRDIDRLAPDWILDVLATRTGTPPERARQTTLDIYQGRLFQHKHQSGCCRWILPAGVYHRTRRHFGLQFCPQCLAEDQTPYFRTSWRLSLLIFCPKHRIQMLDRCPNCSNPVVFHRRELGKPKITDPGLMCLCHVCDYDYRHASRVSFLPYTTCIGTTLNQLLLYASSTGQSSSMSIAHTDVLHQLCKVMIGTSKHHQSLLAYVVEQLKIPNMALRSAHCYLEQMTIEERQHVIQAASWLLADLPTRLTNAWRAKAVRFNRLIKDMAMLPDWYRQIVMPFNRNVLWAVRRQARDGLLVQTHRE